MKNLRMEDCFFCANHSEILGDNLKAYISSTGGADMTGGCTERDYFNFPEELTIIEQTDDTIVAIGEGNGNHEEAGSGCGENYLYNYKTSEKWIFTTGKLGGDTNIKIIVPNDLTNFSAPGFSNPTRGNPDYSSVYMDIYCDSPMNFNVAPFYEVISINGINSTYPALKGQIDREMYRNDTKKTRVRFASYYDARYEIKPYCLIYGAEITKVYSKDTYTVIVSDAPAGNLPENYYN